MAKPIVSGAAQAELDKVEKQFEAFDENVKNLTLDRMSEAPKEETAPQRDISQKEIEKTGDIYLKPKRSISGNDKFNERFRAAYNYDKEYVHFIAEHKEVIGDTIELWTRPYGGVPAEEWAVPSNKPVWGPRYLAEQIKRKTYHRLIMQPTMTGMEGGNQFYGQMAAETTIQRLDARPVSSRKSVFMGKAAGF